jgi:hypothetical protein
LLATANRAIAINDPSIISDELAFKGNSLFALVQHMHRKGLLFAPPQPGAEGLYKLMFDNLRSMYAELAQDKPAGQEQQRNGAENK